MLEVKAHWHSTKYLTFLNMSTLIEMYHVFVFPYPIYCIKIWSNASAIHLDPLINISNKVFKQ